MGSIIIFIVSLLMIWKGSGLIAFIGYCGLIGSVIFILMHIAGAVQSADRQQKEELEVARVEQESQRIIAAATQRPCPMCSETILKTARKCKHCGELIEPDAEYAALMAAQAQRFAAAASPPAPPPLREPVAGANANTAPPQAAQPSANDAKAGTKAMTGGIFLIGGVGYVIAKGLGWL